MFVQELHKSMKKMLFTEILNLKISLKWEMSLRLQTLGQVVKTTKKMDLFKEHQYIGPHRCLVTKLKISRTK